MFAAAAAAGVKALVYASSVGAYSPGPKDRAVDESWPTAGIQTSFYSRHKAEVEQLLDVFEAEHPDVRVVRLRPGLIFKREAASEIRRLFAGPLLPNRLVRPGRIPVVPDTPRLRFQAVHADDVGDAYRRAVVERRARRVQRRGRARARPRPRSASCSARASCPVPRRVLRAAAALTWRARLQPTPEGWVDMALGVPIMDTTRAREELGWTPRHDGGEALLELLGGMRDGAGFPTPPLHPGGSRLRELTQGVGARLNRLRRLLTTVIGSYPQPDWLIDREKLRSSLPARVRMRELWRVPEPHLAAAQDDATALAILDQERAGVDIVTDGEIRRESYSNRFATALDGFDIDNPAMVPGRAGGMNAVPRIIGKVRRTRPVEVDDLRFLREHTDRTIKITLPGPFTMSQQAWNEFYADEAELAMDLAVAVNEELHDLFAAGADVVQIDEPWLQSRAEKARAFALPAIDRALAGAPGTTALHTCFGYAHVVHDRPGGYPFLAELAGCAADVLAVEAAQSASTPPSSSRSPARP